MHLALNEDMVMFHTHFDVVRSTDRVETSPGYCSRLSPTVSRTWCTSSLLGRTSLTKRPYVTVLFLGTEERGVKNMIFDPFMRPPTHWASRQIHLQPLCPMCGNFPRLPVGLCIPNWPLL
jgi:hypothetical protein